MDHFFESPISTLDCSSPLNFNPGDDLVSHAVARAVPSALRGLTSVFGMGTGVTLSARSPETFQNLRVVDNSILMGKDERANS